MSKITNDGLTRSGTGCFIAVAYPYGNSGYQRLNNDHQDHVDMLDV